MNIAMQVLLSSAIPCHDQDDLHGVNSFRSRMGQSYNTEVQLNKAKSFDTEVLFWGFGHPYLMVQLL